MLSVRVRERDANFHSVRVVAITHVLTFFPLPVRFVQGSILYTTFPLTFIKKRNNVRINLTLRSVSVTTLTVEKE